MYAPTLRAGKRRDTMRLGADIVDDGILEPRYPKVQPFPEHVVQHAVEAAEDDGAVAALDREHALANAIYCCARQTQSRQPCAHAVWQP